MASPGCSVRKLAATDYNKGFLQLLSQLTTVGDISEAAFNGKRHIALLDPDGTVFHKRSMCAVRFTEMDSSPDYYVAVAEDPSSGQLLGTAAMIVERKFIHECGKVAHIEDVVVDAAARGQKLGQKLIEHLVAVSKDKGCYKVILDCAEHNVTFYEKCGLTKKEIQMVKYLDR